MANAELRIPTNFSMHLDDVKPGKMYVYDGCLIGEYVLGAPCTIVTVIDTGWKGRFHLREAHVRVAHTGSHHYIAADSDDRVPLIPIELKVLFPPEGVEPT